MAPSKGETYAHELNHSRLRGIWDHGSSHGASRGSSSGALPDLIRKFSKHNSHSPVGDVANTELELRALLQYYWQDAKWSDHGHASDFARPGRVGHTAFPPSVPSSGSGPGWSADKYAALVSKLESLEKRASNPTHVAAILAYALVCAGKDEDAILLLHQVKLIESTESEGLKDPSSTNNYDVALLLLGFVVYGMANERLHNADPSAGYAPFAFAGYARAIDLYEGVRGLRTEDSSRLSTDEIDRWGEVALYRNALLSVREGDTIIGLNALRAYQAHAAHWPNDFRMTQRAVIYRTYLEVLNRTVAQHSYLPPPGLPEPGQHDPRSAMYQVKAVQSVASRMPLTSTAAIRAKRGEVGIRPGSTARSVISRTTSSRRPHTSTALRPGSLIWADEVYSISNALPIVAARSSDFPHAGQTNLLAVELADAVVTSWRLAGSQGAFVADDLAQSLYTLARVTFDSHLISRSLVEVLTAGEQYTEAKRALDLYVELVEKAREAKEAEKKNARHPESEANGVEASNQIEGEDEHTVDQDDSATYVRALIFGSRLLYKYLGLYAEADRLGRRAVEIIETDKSLAEAPAALEAFVKRGAGIARAWFAGSQQDPSDRAPLQQEALKLLTDASKLDDQAAETFYHLSWLQAELHDVESATASGRRAVELEPGWVDAWHLLALLLSAKKDFKAALHLAQVALDEAEADASHDLEIVAQETQEAQQGEVQIADAVELRTALISLDFPPTQTDRDESVLQLLVTHNALEELVTGTTLAIEGQKEIFAYFHNHIATSAAQILGQTAPGPAPGQTSAAELQIDTHPPGFFHRRGSRFASLLHVAPKDHSHGIEEDAGTYSTVTGLGQTGVHAAPTSTVVVPVDVTSPVAAPPPVLASDVKNPKLSPRAQVRFTQRAKKETKLLAQLWLLSAATFRRAGQLADGRVAIQEAERAVPDEAGVWTQLGLYHAENDRITAAVNCLYKAIACDPTSVPASVHLARLLLSNPEDVHLSSAVSTTLTPANVSTVSAQSRSIASPLTEEVKAEELVGDAKSLPANASTHSNEQLTDPRPTSLSLAEAFLTTATSGTGWDAPEAWLYLGHVAQQTQRPERAVECLKYALWLEQTKPVRPLREALAYPPLAQA